MMKEIHSLRKNFNFYTTIRKSKIILIFKSVCSLYPMFVGIRSFEYGQFISIFIFLLQNIVIKLMNFLIAQVYNDKLITSTSQNFHVWLWIYIPFWNSWIFWNDTEMFITLRFYFHYLHYIFKVLFTLVSKTTVFTYPKRNKSPTPFLKKKKWENIIIVKIVYKL